MRSSCSAFGQVGSGHVLAPYLEYWRLKLRLEDAPDADVRAFLEREQAGSYLAERLRADWLKELGKRGDWQSFERSCRRSRRTTSRSAATRWLSRLARGDEGAFDEARAIWLEPRELPEGCDALADRMLEARQVQRRRRLAARAAAVRERRSSARRGARSATCPRARSTTRRCSTRRRPRRRSCSQPAASLERRATREMVVFAVVRLARSDPEAAAEVLQRQARRSACRRRT